MDTTSRYVTDLGDWDLPRAEELEFQLLQELIAKTQASALTAEILGEELYAVFFDGLRKIAGAVVNETIEYWLKGFTNGGDGKLPELCIEFPYLLHNEDVGALTLDYCVDNQDGTRTRLHRMDLPTALIECLERIEGRAGVTHKAPSVMAAALRSLAQQLEHATFA